MVTVVAAAAEEEVTVKGILVAVSHSSRRWTTLKHQHHATVS